VLKSSKEQNDGQITLSAPSMKRCPSRSYTTDLTGHLTLGRQKVSDRGQAALMSAALASSSILATMFDSSVALRNESDEICVTHNNMPEKKKNIRNNVFI
jgi:hypothetical protein